MVYNSEQCLKYEEIQSKMIDFLRFPLTIGVVIIHCRYTRRLQNLLYNYVNIAEIYDYISYFFSRSILSLCVPVFFFISGFLFFKNGFSFQIYINKLKKRFFTIFIPFVIWNLIYIIIYYVDENPIMFSDNGKVIGIVPWLNGNTGFILKNILRCIWGVFVNFNGSGSPADVPFWYLRDLICICVLSPIIYYIFDFNYVKKYGIFLLVFFWVITSKYYLFPYIFLRPATLFYMMGAFFAIKKYNLVVFFTSIGNYIYFGYIINILLDLFTKNYEYNCYINKITVLFGIIVAFKISIHIVSKTSYRENDIMKMIKNTNIFIYASHWMFLYWISYPLYNVCFVGAGLSLTLIYFIQIILCCTLLILIGIILNLLFPRLMKFINGR